MWLFTPRGFFSAVEHKDNEDLVLVRSRFIGDLEKLCEYHGFTPEVERTPHADYPFRMTFDKTEWANIVKAEALDIDYTNFKSRAHDGTPRDGAYMGVWATLRGASHGR